MLSLSKSKYCGLWQCPKIAWLNKYKPEVMEVSPALQDRMDTGNVVGDLAMGLFGDFVEVTSVKEDGRIDIATMIKRTQDEMAKGTNVSPALLFVSHLLPCSSMIWRSSFCASSIRSPISTASSINSEKSLISKAFFA